MKKIIIYLMIAILIGIVTSTIERYTGISLYEGVKTFVSTYVLCFSMKKFRENKRKAIA